MSNLFRPQRRKLAALILVGILMILSLTGCKKDDPTVETTLPTDTVEATSPVETTAPTIPVVTEEPIMTGTVTAGELNVREGIGTKYDVVRKLQQNDVVDIYEQQDYNGVMWGRIVDGWICLAYVQVDNNPEAIPAPPEYILTEPVTGTIIATELNVRSGPGTNYQVAATLKRGQTITVTELNGNWGKTEDGWVNTFFVYFEGTIDASPVAGQVTTNGLNVRSGPGTAYESLEKLDGGTEVTIYKQVEVHDVRWGYTGVGWVCLDYVRVADAE